MVFLKNRDECCGCMACSIMCPQDAIFAEIDEYGFTYPAVDTTKCNNCGICIEYCAFSNEKNNNDNIKKMYAYRINDKCDLKNSTSGGAFTSISNIVLDNGGFVYGAVMDDTFDVYHCEASTFEERNSMRMSKYVQSNTLEAYKKVIEHAKNGDFVMYVGTPCQTAQLEKCIKEYRDKVLLCDFICHGVPSNSFFKEHIRFLEKKYNKSAKKYLFRNKKYGWNHAVEEIVFEDNTLKNTKYVQCYSKFFYTGMSLRESCHNCRYRSMHRYTDFTIADFWGAEKLLNIKDNKGLSLIAVNSSQGEAFVKKLEKSGFIEAVDKEVILPRLSEKLPLLYGKQKEFWDIYRKKGYEGLVKTFTDTSLKTQLIFSVKNIVKILLGVIHNK